ncbi:MAG: hypothetical protein WCJ01_10555 [Ignavibacteria bacterium]
MNLELAETILLSIKDTKQKESMQALLDLAIRYANIRARWAVISREEQMEMNQSRTIAHNALINGCNILSENMAQNGESNAWRNILGNDRKIIGDFACYVSCLLGIATR